MTPFLVFLPIKQFPFVSRHLHREKPWPGRPGIHYHDLFFISQDIRNVRQAKSPLINGWVIPCLSCFGLRIITPFPEPKQVTLGEHFKKILRETGR